MGSVAIRLETEFRLALGAHLCSSGYDAAPWLIELLSHRIPSDGLAELYGIELEDLKNAYNYAQSMWMEKVGQELRA